MSELTARQAGSSAPLYAVSVESEARFLDMRSQWNRLAERHHSPSVFFHHEWFEAAWAWRKHDSKLLVLCAYTADVLVGVLPLVLKSAEVHGLHLRRLELLTVPDTQLCDLLVAEDQTDAVVTAFVRELSRQRSRWDEMRLDYLREGALASTVLMSALRRHGYRSEMRNRGRNLSVALDTSWPDYYSTRTRSLKKANNLAANRLRKRGKLAVEWLQPAARDRATLAGALDAVIDVSRRSWKRETGTTLDQPAPGAFIHRLSELAGERGWLSIWTLRLNGEPLATEYQLVYAGQVHALRADFDSSFTDISPGSYLSHHLLQELFKLSLKRYCMGPGENAYKLRWSSDGDRLSQLVVYGRTLRGRVHWLREAIVKPRLKRFLSSFQSSKVQSAAKSVAEQPSVNE